MDRRYQIFVSSTFSDLIEERRAVTQALLSLNHFPAGMELFPASNDDQWTLIKGVIDDSDYYILVIGARYGSIADEGISYTEKEFDYAVASGIPVLAFVHEQPGDIPAKKTDQNDEARKKLEAFRAKVMKGRLVKMWSTSENLETRVVQAISAETKRNPREGWVRGNVSGDPAQLNALLNEISDLKKQLIAARTTPPIGSETYAQGGDEFEIGCEYRITYSHTPVSKTVRMSWDQIFYAIGPLMIGEASEAALKRRLQDELPRYDDDIDFLPERSEMEHDNFETIKVQLQALGLIKKGDKKRAPSDHNIYWQLTPYGEQYITRLRAIKKNGNGST